MPFLILASILYITPSLSFASPDNELPECRGLNEMPKKCEDKRFVNEVEHCYIHTIYKYKSCKEARKKIYEKTQNELAPLNKKIELLSKQAALKLEEKFHTKLIEIEKSAHDQRFAQSEGLHISLAYSNRILTQIVIPFINTKTELSNMQGEVKSIAKGKKISTSNFIEISRQIDDLKRRLVALPQNYQVYKTAYKEKFIQRLSSPDQNSTQKHYIEHLDFYDFVLPIIQKEITFAQQLEEGFKTISLNRSVVKKRPPYLIYRERLLQLRTHLQEEPENKSYLRSFAFTKRMCLKRAQDEEQEKLCDVE